MSPTDLEAYGIYEGRKTRLKFEGGVIVEGEIITGKRNLQGKIILISFRNCRVTLRDEVLFHPDWGIYDMAVGESVISAFSGIADPNSFGQQFEVPKEKTHKISYSEKEEALFDLYQEVRNYRSQKRSDESFLNRIFDSVVSEYPNDWLLALEIYELLDPVQSAAFRDKISLYLNQNFTDRAVQQLILDGIRLVNNS